MVVLLFYLILFSWALLSAILYILTIFIIIKKRRVAPFISDFFKLFVSLGVADLCSGVNSSLLIIKHLGWLDALYGDSQLEPLFQSIHQKVYLWILLVQYSGVLALAANRFYTKEYPLWTRNKQMLALVFQWLAPTLIMVPYVSLSIFFDDSLKTAAMFGCLMMLFEISIIIVVGILYSRIYWHIRKMRQEFGLSADHQSEYRLAMVGFVLFVLMSSQQMVIISMIVSVGLGYSRVFTFLKSLVYYIGIIFAFANPWLLGICSQTTRDAIKEWICCKQQTDSGPVVPSQPLFQLVSKVHSAAGCPRNNCVRTVDQSLAPVANQNLEMSEVN